MKTNFSKRVLYTELILYKSVDVKMRDVIGS